MIIPALDVYNMYNIVRLLCLLLISSNVYATCPQTYWYSVKPNGKALTRPAYILKDGVLGKKVVARAWIGSTCDTKTKPTLPSKNGKDLYASYDSTGLVALCSKQ